MKLSKHTRQTATWLAWVRFSSFVETPLRHFTTWDCRNVEEKDVDDIGRCLLTTSFRNLDFPITADGVQCRKYHCVATKVDPSPHAYYLVRTLVRNCARLLIIHEEGECAFYLWKTHMRMLTRPTHARSRTRRRFDRSLASRTLSIWAEPSTTLSF